MKIRITPTLFALIPFLLIGCGQFDKKWQQAVLANPAGIEGAWEGTWTSAANGHHGELKCIVSKDSTGEYEFLYWASWGRIFSGTFLSTHKITPKGNALELSGEEDLGGALGGKFSFSGTIKGDDFFANFKSDRGDKGVFEMKKKGVKKN